MVDIGGTVHANDRRCRGDSNENVRASGGHAPAAVRSASCDRSLRFSERVAPPGTWNSNPHCELRSVDRTLCLKSAVIRDDECHSIRDRSAPARACSHRCCDRECKLDLRTPPRAVEHRALQRDGAKHLGRSGALVHTPRRFRVCVPAVVAVEAEWYLDNLSRTETSPETLKTLRHPVTISHWQDHPPKIFLSHVDSSHPRSTR